MSIKFYVLGGPRYKPPGVSRGSPRLHFIIMFMLMFVCCCCDRNKVQFNSSRFSERSPLDRRAGMSILVASVRRMPLTCSAGRNGSART